MMRIHGKSSRAKVARKLDVEVIKNDVVLKLQFDSNNYFDFVTPINTLIEAVGRAIEQSRLNTSSNS